MVNIAQTLKPDHLIKTFLTDQFTYAMDPVTVRRKEVIINKDLLPPEFFYNCFYFFYYIFWREKV